MATTIANNDYVIIDKNDLVISVFKGSELPEYNEEMVNVIDVTTLTVKPQLNWTYNKSKNKFTEPAIVGDFIITEPEKTPVEILRDELKDAVDSIEYMGTTFQTGGFTISYINSYVSLLYVSGSLPENFFWLDKFNNKVFMTEQEFKTFAEIVITNYYTNFANYVNKKIDL